LDQTVCIRTSLGDARTVIKDADLNPLAEVARRRRMLISEPVLAPLLVPV
jgi:hypothetical protein